MSRTDHRVASKSRQTRSSGLVVRSGVRAGSDNPTRDMWRNIGWQSS